MNWLGGHVQQVVVNGIKDRGKEAIKHLCIVYVPVCEVTDPVKQWTNFISDSHFSNNII